MRRVAFVLVLLGLGTIAMQGAPDDFDVEYERLRRGREYKAAKTGTITYRLATADGRLFETFVDIPESYDPARPWPVRVQLHGGVARPLEKERPRTYRLESSAPEIAVHPRGWTDAQWWHVSQVENVSRVLERLKREYNVDESRVYLTGFSDGATGAFFFAMRAPTPFSVFVPLHGSINVLAHPATGADGQMYPGNLVNRPMLATNGGRDQLYPSARMMPLMQALQQAGVDVIYLPLPLAGHELSWWPTERERIEYFLAQNPRKPHPARLSWETERTDRYNRVDWLAIEELGSTSSDQPLADVNPSGLPRARPSGRVDVERTGNTFEAHTRGVRRFRLLISPDVVDFAQPVKVIVNGRTAVERMVAKDRGVLRKWADRDQDRTVLYAAEVVVEVK